jgi:hypothetical protein
MLEELALLAAARPVAEQPPDGWALTAPQSTTDLETPPASPVLGMPLAPLTGADSPTEEDSPSPTEAARRLARFTEEVRVVRPPPLITSPPKQPPPKPFVPKRSRRIADQRMDHIPTSKRGEVLLMRKMEFLEPSAPPSSAAKDSYESFFAGDITEADAKTLDSLFPAYRGRSR